ncbi:MAG: hypothetical protein LUC93_14275 [Planctomycetaceae bacterium]|nr:hypothetical protein [Planctomycetaceae bacterium]
MNIIERMLAAKAGLGHVEAGQEITVSVDLALAHDVTAPIAIQQFRSIGATRVYDPAKVVFVMDHNIPCSTVDSRRQHRIVQQFCDDFGTKLYNRAEGVIHQLAFEEGLYNHGDIVVGADSHTCTAGAKGAIAIPLGSTETAAVMALGELDLEVPETHIIRFHGEFGPYVYGKDVILTIIGRFTTNGFTDKAVVFTGDAIAKLPQSEKMTMANMMIEMGAMIGYIDQGGEDLGEPAIVHDIQASEIVPVAACPASPGNVKPLSDVAGTRISQAVLGSCTNGRYEDMAIAAEVLRGRTVADGVTMVVVPASKRILDKMEENGLTKVFRDAGAIVTNPGCGPCFGAHQGLLTPDDVAVSSTNRNFPGRMGDKAAQIYLASPRVVAESAVAGTLVEPGTVVREGK